MASVYPFRRIDVKQVKKKKSKEERHGYITPVRLVSVVAAGFEAEMCRHGTHMFSIGAQRISVVQLSVPIRALQ